VSFRCLRATLIALVLALALALPAAASAQVADPASEEYPTTEQQVEDQVAVGGGGGGDEPSAGGGVLGDRVVSSLPFTGFDLVAMAFAAAAVMGTGFALRRFSRPPQAGE
jgi:hypothetical protein